jgi:dUTP pyrophosphatase
MSIKVHKKLPNAVIPSKAHSTDIGLDLVALKVHKIINQDIIMYDTGISVKPPPGFYLEIVPRSSITKTGWMLANSVGIIDPDYRGTLYIVLIRVLPDAKNLIFPFCYCQLVLRKIENYPVIEVEDDFSSTVRGEGGFGSTGDRNL